MKKIEIVAICAALVFLCVANFAQADDVWTTLDAPFVVYQTIAYGISGDNIIGTYDASDGQHGFVYEVETKTWNVIDIPGTEMVEMFGISGNDAVGSYYTSTPNKWHGLLYNIVTRSWASLDMPGADSMNSTGIDGDNIIGQWLGGASGLHGFLYDGATWTTLNAPGANDTKLMGISGDNIVGYTDNVGSFLYNGATWTTIYPPAGIGAIYPRGISGRKIVGLCIDLSSKFHGFVYNYYDKTLTTLDMPGADMTYPQGIDGNNIVGSYNDSSGTHGFLYVPPKVSVGAMTVPLITLAILLLSVVFIRRNQSVT